MGIVGLAFLLVIGGLFVYVYYFVNPHYVNVNGEQSSPKGQVNILMIGSTTRCGLKHQNKAYGLCVNTTGVNSDIVMVMHLNLTTNKVSLLSIPRDLFVPNARPNGQYGQFSANKIDSALVDGPSQLVSAIEEDFGIGINHLVELNFDTFASVVDTLGGINMYFPDPLFDAESGLNIKTTGCIHLNGFEALQVVRARHLQYQPKGEPNNFVHQQWTQEALSDIARIQRTHEFLRILAEDVRKNHDIFNLGQDLSLANDVVPNLTVDAGWNKFSMANLAEQFAGTHITDVPQYTYPIVTVGAGYGPSGYIYQGGQYGDIEFPVQPGGYAAVNTIFDVAPGLNSFTGKPLPSPSSVKIMVDNGTTNAGEAGSIASKLSGRGFHVTGVGSTTPNNPAENETVVWYGGPPPPAHKNWKSPDLAAAEAVEEQLSGPVIMGWDPAMVPAGSQVRLILGNDTQVLPKGRLLTATTTTTSSTSSTTTSTVAGHHVTTTTVTPTTVYDPPGIKGDGHLGSPTSLSTALAWYDPRACNAAGTGKGTY